MGGRQGSGRQAEDFSSERKDSESVFLTQLPPDGARAAPARPAGPQRVKLSPPGARAAGSIGSMGDPEEAREDP